MQDNQYDIIIVGAGIVGCMMANLIAKQLPRYKVLLLDRQAPPAYGTSAPIDSRVYAINHTAKQLLESLSLWPQVGGARCCAYQKMQVWQDDIQQSLIFDAADIACEDLGYIIEHQVLHYELLQLAQQKLTVLLEHNIQNFEVGPDIARLTLDSGQQLQATLCIAADGANSALRQLANIDVQKSHYAQAAIVANVTTDKPHQHTAWQRFLSTGPLAFLPLADGSSSIVWSVNQSDLAPLLESSDAVFMQELSRQSQYLLGNVRTVTARRRFVLQHLLAERYVKPRLALIGDAAHVVHPLAGQGLNLGLQDVSTLMGLLRDAEPVKQDIGQLLFLRRYQRHCQSHNKAMSDFFGGLNGLFASEHHALKLLRQHGLSWINQLKPIKRFISQQAIGKI